MRSVLKQTRLPKKIIIVFDCDPDFMSSIKLLDELMLSDPDIGLSIKYVNNRQNKGPGYSRNLGWSIAKTKYVAFLDADDAWLESKLEVQIGLMEDHNIDLCCTAMGVWKDNENSGKERCSDSSVDFLLTFHTIKLNHLIFKSLIKTSSVIIKTSIDRRFVETRKFVEDLPLWIDILSLNYNAVLIDSELAFAFKRSYGVSGLSGAIYKMENAVQLCFDEAYKKGQLSLGQKIVAQAFSRLKFLRRLIIYYTHIG